LVSAPVINAVAPSAAVEGASAVPACRRRKGEIPMSFKPEVIADSSGKWSGNALRFATREEAEANVHDLMMRWFAVRDTRVVECDDPVNYSYIDHKLLPLPAAEITPVPALDQVTQLQGKMNTEG
jgi:hypothetical protein